MSSATQSRPARRFDNVLIGDRWERGIVMETCPSGRIAALRSGPEGGRGERVTGWAVPGVPNLHGHAFQRGLAGLAEGGGPQSFWGWREVMYAFLDLLGPEDAESIAAQLHVELLRSGFTCVGEFHYLHRLPGGGRYDDPAEMSRRIVAAARRTGIGLVHMPTVYEAGGFGGEALEGGQRRFAMDLDGAERLRELLRPECSPRIRLGWALHSLRAVSPATVAQLGDRLGRRDPVHVHAAEQLREVRECIERRGAPPVRWLLDHAPVDGRWCIVHATHATEAELRSVAGRAAVVGLCPATEANLGDGVFPLRAFADLGGRFGIGTDSHVSRSPAEELRILDYGQRLVSRRRSILTDPGRPGAATGALAGAGGALLARAWRDGCRALGWNGGRIEVGRNADLVVLDAEHPALAGRSGRAVLDSWVFSGTETPVRDVMVAGEWVVRDGHHRREEEVGRAFAETVRGLADRV